MGPPKKWREHIVAHPATGYGSPIMTTPHITAHRAGFAMGYTPITHHDDPQCSTGIGFGVLKLAAQQTHTIHTHEESAWLLMNGTCAVHAANQEATLTRASLYEQGPSCVHVAADTHVKWEAHTDVELLVFTTANTHNFSARIYTPVNVPTEHRGRGWVDNACYRLVRTIFDRNNADPHAELVLGEVVALPGRWSSYPPHHHPQPEIYHYRFTQPQGFGFSQLGDQAYLVRHGDTVKIAAGQDHAQAAAPGYGMYYAWVIRHLPKQPYTHFDYTPEHQWITQPNAAFWLPLDQDT